MTKSVDLLMESASQWIVLAHILRPQGRRGEVLADLFTDFPERFGQHPQVWIARQGFAEQAAMDPIACPPPESATVDSHWLPVGRNAGRIVLHFTGIDTIEQAQQLASKEVLVPRAERMPLSPGAAYISDLIGCTVYDHGRALGVVDSVQFPTSPDGSRRLEDAPPLLAVTSLDGSEILIPFAREFVLDLDPAAKSIRMALPEGLTEINQPGDSSAPKE
jgi:16S rRNA processing protein RimM